MMWSKYHRYRTCKTCKYFIEEDPVDVERTYTIVGRCRRHAPVSGVGYPEVYPNEGCGDHKVDENRV